MDILRDLRLGEFDVLVGINLLREGLDLPEVNLVAILDADKEGFLRSERSLIQTAGRAARNAESVVVLYADRVTDSMARMMEETERRREIQAEYNREHDITPTTVTKSIDEVRRGTAIADHKAEQDERKAKQATTYYSGPDQLPKVADPVVKYLTDDQKRDPRRAAHARDGRGGREPGVREGRRAPGLDRPDRGHARRLTAPPPAGGVATLRPCTV